MTTTTLTDRYIWAVQRSLPERQRDDIDKELRGTIADTVDAKIEGGAKPDAAERETITELGDPYRLAAGYADRPLQLIGAKVFPDYIRLLKVLYVIVLPIAFAGILLGQLLGGHEFWGSFGSTIGATITVAVHFGFWTTLIFALIERSPDYKANAWNPDTLPQLPARGAIKLSDTIAGIIWYAIVLGALAWAQLRGYPAGTAVFDPPAGLWQVWFLALPILAIVFRVSLYRWGHWTWPLAIVSYLGGLAFAIPALWLLLSGQLFNPLFLDRLPDGVAPLFAPEGAVTVASVIVILIGLVAGVVDTTIKTVRADRRS